MTSGQGSKVDPRAERGFGSGAERYERARPGWPAAAVDQLFEHFGLSPASTVLDLVAGTGKLSRELVSRGGRVVAVEPSAAMRAVLEQFVPGAEVRAGTAAELPLEAASVDAVFVAEAFHWFAERRHPGRDRPGAAPGRRTGPAVPHRGALHQPGHDRTG